MLAAQVTGGYLLEIGTERDGGKLAWVSNGERFVLGYGKAGDARDAVRLALIQAGFHYAADAAALKRLEREYFGPEGVWAIPRTVGGLRQAALCAGCGATCPNSWSEPLGYVTVGGVVYCDANCERVHTAPQTEGDRDAPYVKDERYGK